ncbi:MAG: SDR family oxidoreductase [Pseudomonadota bacterium]
MQVHLLGCGDLGSALGLKLLQRRDEPLALRRTPSAAPSKLPAKALDYTDADAVAALAYIPADITVLTPTPAGRDVEAYRQGYLKPVENLLAAWASGPPRSLLYVSSTRVYGDRRGDWVDEATPVAASDGPGEVLVEAEQRLLESAHDVSIVRFSGIYGRLPSHILTRIQSGEIVRPEPVHYSNRIHRDDCVGFLLHLIDSQQREPIYLASDDAPTPLYEVEQWLAEQMGVTRPKPIIAPPTASRRCRNSSLKRSGYSLLYPDFRAGYSAMIASTSIAAPRGKAAT